MDNLANIGPRQRRRRMRYGLVLMAASALLAGGLLALGAPRPLRLLVLLPLWIAATGFFQAREKT